MGTGYRTCMVRNLSSTMRDFGALTRKRRLDLGMAQAELARRVGLARAHISRIECGRRGTRLETAVSIANALGVSLSELLKEEP